MLQLQGVASDKHQLPLDKKVSLHWRHARSRYQSKGAPPEWERWIGSAAAAPSLPFKTPDKHQPPLNRVFSSSLVLEAAWLPFNTSDKHKVPLRNRVFSSRSSTTALLRYLTKIGRLWEAEFSFSSLVLAAARLPFKISAEVPVALVLELYSSSCTTTAFWDICQKLGGFGFLPIFYVVAARLPFKISAKDLPPLRNRFCDAASNKQVEPQADRPLPLPL